MEIRNRFYKFMPLNKIKSGHRRLRQQDSGTTMKKILTQEGRNDIRYWVNKVRMLAGPDEVIDLVALAQKAGINIKTGNYNHEFLGMLVLKGRQFTIHLNLESGDKIKTPLIRYTLAHELGHFFIPSHRARLLSGEGISQDGYILVDDELAEKEAEYFASCLLMPEEYVVPLFHAEPLSHRLLWDWADRFKVSVAAIAGRYTTLGPTPILVVWSTNGQYEKANKSKGFPYFKLNHPSGNQMPDCCFAAIAHKADGSNETLIQTLPASSVLKSSREIPEDMRLVEFSYFMHRQSGKMLSVFWEEGE